MTKQQKSTVIVLIAGAFLSVINQTLINPALPSIMADLSVNAATAQYLVSIFTLVNAIVITISAFLMDKFSTRKLFLAVFSLFLLGSLLAAWGPNFICLLIGRILQAVCAGIMLPLSMTMLLLIFPHEKRGSAMGMYSFVIMFAPAIGPVISGVLTDHIGWRVMFLIMAVLAVAVLAFAAFKLENFGETKPVTLDKLSVTLSSVGLFVLLYGFSALSSSSTLIFGAVAILIGIVCLIFFSKRQLKLEEPFLEIRVLADKQFRIGAIVLMLISASLTAVSITLPIYIQTVLGLSATLSGTVMLPGAIFGAIAGYFAGNLYDKFGARWLSIIGVLFVTGGSIAMSLFGFKTTVLYMIVTYCLRSIGLMLANTPINIWALNKLPNNIIHHANAVQSTLRQVGSTLGVAIMVSVMSLVTSLSSKTQGTKQAQLTGISAAYWLAAAIAIICLIIVIINVWDTKKTKTSTVESGIALGTESELDKAMKRTPYTVSESATLAEVIDIFINRKTTGLPVIDESKRIVGYISDGDVLRYLSKHDIHIIASEYLDVLPDPEDFNEKAKELLSENVMKIATKRIISVEHTTSLSDVCRLFSEKKLSKLPVTHDGILLGTISRGDIMRTLMSVVTVNE
ncbi:MAG: DHA2 family efflux MFS transporter permease subunit [Clostridiales Family XIII bacterium]|jgi:EmrB/QacA subfamily drug resistance transporter|nr:DHA2 family efflux MFS transporter permease subunit [Clostridiales Family XIII bacterium]